MNTSIAIAVGGAFGALARFWTSNAVYNVLGKDFPYGTLAVNVIGSLLMGFLYVLFMERLGVANHWRALILIGFLGSFTTFSTFSMDTITLIQSGELLKAIMNMLMSVVVCVSAAWFGVIVMRQI